MAAHHFHHDDAVVALGGGVQAIECFRGGADGGVEPERQLGAEDIVVDGLGHADHGQSLERQVVGNLETAIAPDGDQRIEPRCMERGDQIVGAVALVLRTGLVAADVAERIAPVGGAENGAADMGDAAHFGGTERHHAVETQEPFEPALDAVGPPAPMLSGEHDRTDHGIETRRVPAAGRDGYSQPRILSPASASAPHRARRDAA